MSNQIIGIDLADERIGDCSVITTLCGSCMTVFEINRFSNEELPQITVFRSCPICKAKFTGHVINE